ncbi:MAG TPA: lamin tail domain-containing protein [Polyangiaceae bacterium]|nr:lamin tail domain-containing protein [Polyangiaceae bacterium]
MKNARGLGPRTGCLVGFGLLLGCSLDLPEPPGPADAGAVFGDRTGTDAAVPRVFVAKSRVSDAPLPRLFEGELSEYHLNRADEVDLPGTLLQRQIPLWAWAQGQRQTLLPLQSLAPRARYSLVLHSGSALAFTTRVKGPDATRAWPGPTTARVAAYCDANAGTLARAFASRGPQSGKPAWQAQSATSVRLLAGSRAHWEALGGRPDCAALVIDAALPAQGDVFTLVTDGLLLEPTWFDPRQAAAIPKLGPDDVPECAQGEQPLAIGCASVEDDRVRLRTDSVWALWQFGGALEVTIATGPEQSGVITGLEPNTRYELSLALRLPEGSQLFAHPTITTSAARPHLVISEVLANPLGSEPAQEWIELYNDGSASVDLAGYVLRDSGGDSPIPSGELAAHSYVVLVNQDFEDPPPWDVALAEGSLVIRLPRLGVSGLANGGEPLDLLDGSGRIVSRFLYGSSEPGTSFARKNVELGADSAIGKHASPGASPGAPNTLADDL